MPFDAALDTGGLIVLLIGAMFAGGAGIGGGEFYVPVLVLLMQFAVREAIPLSSTLVLGLGLANVALLARKRHPYRDRPLIDVWLGAMFAPGLLVGSVVGVLINQTTPSWFVILVLFFVMLAAAVRSGILAAKLWRKETERTKQVEADIELAGVDAVGTIERAPSSKRKQRVQFTNEQERLDAERAAASKRTMSSEQVKRLNKMALDYVMEKESRTALGAVAAIVACLVVVSLCSWLKGSDSAKSVIGTEPCSPGYWAMQFVPLVVLVGIWLFVAGKLIVDQQLKETVPGYKPVEGDIAWTWRIAGTIAAASFCVGCVTALVGVGGGVVLGPLFIELNVLPDVAAAVSSLIVLLGAISSVVQFAANDRIELGYGLLAVGIGIVGSAIGTTTVRWLVNRYDRSAIIVVVLVCTLAVSLVLVVATGIVVLTTDGDAAALSFRGVCD